ncbi:MAG: tetratricopeptide repeat protein [Deltaproteobacteria bacterium]|nr:tetratricopeptide repeat protein [Deltaproteobacteria bacterium]
MEIEPRAYEVYNERGLVRYSLNQLEKSLADFNVAIALNKKYAQAYMNRGTIKTEMKNYQAAIIDFSHAIEINPKDVLAYISRGTIFMVHFNDNKKACTDWKRACELGSCRNYKFARKKGLCR